MNKNNAAVLTALLIILTGSVLGYLGQTDFTKVKVNDIRFKGENGNTISALLYVPENATDETPAPAVLSMHGFSNTRESQSSFNIEFARRGYVVLSPDATGFGYSEQTHEWKNIKDDPSFPFGASDCLNYLTELPFVDKDKISGKGHHIGGFHLIAAEVENPGKFKTLIFAGSRPVPDNILPDKSSFNLGVIYGLYDELSAMVWLIEKPATIVSSQILKSAFRTESRVKPYKLYGSFEDRTARIFYSPEQTHLRNTLSSETTSYAVDFLQKSIPAPEPVDPSRQIWHLKEAGTLLILAGIIIFIFALASRLSGTAFFSSVKRKQPPSAAMDGKGWWSVAAITSFIPVFIYTETAEPFHNDKISYLWPQIATNGAVRFLMIFAFISFILFLIWHLLFARRAGGNSVSCGISTDTEKPAFSIKYIGKALLLAAVTVGAAHIILCVVQWIFILDARWWMIALKPMDISRFLISFAYLPPFLFFSIVNGLVLHGQLRVNDSGSEFITTLKSMLTATLINILGLSIMIGAHLKYLFDNGMVISYHISPFTIFIYQIIFVLALAGALSAWFFRKTGNIYTGSFFNAFLITWYFTAGQAIMMPV